MNREALRPVLLAAVCVIAIVLASATLTATVDTSGAGGTGGGASEGSGASEGGSIDLGGDPGSSDGIADLADEGQFGPLCLAALDTTEARAGLVLVMVVTGLAFRRRMGTFLAAAITGILALPVLIGYAALIGGCRGDQTGKGGVPETLAGRASGGESEGVGTGVPVAPVDLPAIVFVIAGVVLVGLLAMAVVKRDAIESTLASVTPTVEEAPEEEPTTGSPTPMAVGRAAGRAADRIESGTDADNGVYRAWVEMTRHLDVAHPESSTPAEFVDAAVEAGMDREDVEELTALFEEVRYGGRDATPDREERAIAALRRIEREYAGGFEVPDADDEDGAESTGDGGSPGDADPGSAPGGDEQ